ncbi:MAG: hypothetical protein H6568_14915 [Lewinellaceae bacterium]|nr:hypothetical protein [Saprospiraceae bacterium]MCB9314048.1 hypothetical protein [Lewinellaceae bacterium]
MSTNRLFFGFRYRCLLLGFVLGATLFAPACSSSKSGCPVNDNADNVKLNKNGEMSSKRGKSNLFPKNMRKKY